MIIIPRVEWGARYGVGSEDVGPEARVVIHHSHKPALLPSATPAAEVAAVQGIERFHGESNGWEGIGYNFLVAPSGRIYEGRGWKYRGAHAGPVNGDSIGICLLIDGNTVEPNAAAVDSVRALIAKGVQLGEIKRGYRLSGHRDHMPSRSCPGVKVYARLQDLRHDAAVIPPVTPSLAPTSLKATPVRVDYIEIPARKHVEEIVRVRELDAGVARAGIQVAEVLLRGVVRGQPAGRREAVKFAADAFADWLKANRADP